MIKSGKVSVKNRVPGAPTPIVPCISLRPNCRKEKQARRILELRHSWAKNGQAGLGRPPVKAAIHFVLLILNMLQCRT